MMNELMQRNQANALMLSDPAAVAAAEGAKARIQSAYIMARQWPRSYDQARVRILKACRRPDFAEKVEYSKPVGGKSIVGPSIRFAELALREWGNVLYENQVVYDDENVRRVRVVIIDLETNTTYGREVQMTKTVERKNPSDREVLGERVNSEGKSVYTVRATEDELLTREAALISKALRNEGLRLIPQEIVEESIREARSTVRNSDAMDPDAAKNRLIDLFYSVNVSPVDLERYLRHPIEQTSAAELGELRKIYTAIKEGEAHWTDFAARADESDDARKEETPDLSVLNGTAAPVRPQKTAGKTQEKASESRKSEEKAQEAAGKVEGKSGRKPAGKADKADSEDLPDFAQPEAQHADAAELAALREENARRATGLGWNTENKRSRLRKHGIKGDSILLLDMEESKKLSFALDAEEAEKKEAAKTDVAQVASLNEKGFGGVPFAESDENGAV